MPLTLSWRSATTLPVEGSGLNPEALSPLSEAEAARLTVPVGNATMGLRELFQVAGSAADGVVVFEGDLRHVGGLGQGMASGALVVRGDAGSRLGAEMTGGTIDVAGTVGDWAGAGMRGGTLRVRGDVGHDLGAAWPGSPRGMTGGVILIEGAAGDDVGRALRRGLIAVAGRTGDNVGHGLIAGSIFTFGPVGAYPGAGMKRGTLALFGAADAALPPTFAPCGRFRPPIVTVYLRELRALGFPVPDAAFFGPLERYNGDLVEHGQGEVLIGCAHDELERASA